MRKNIFVALASAIIASLCCHSAPAQLPGGLKIPKVSKPKPTPMPTETAPPATQPRPAASDTPAPPPPQPASGPGGLAVMKHWVRVEPRLVTSYKGDSKTFSWTPVVRFDTTGPHPSGSSYYVKVSLPGGAPWVEMDCEWGGKSFECGGPNFPEEKGTTATGLFPFTIHLRNPLHGTDQVMFSGRVKIEKGPATDTLTPAEGAKMAVFYTNLESVLPVGYVFYDNPRNEVHVAFWVRGEYSSLEAHAFYRGKEIVFDFMGNQQAVEGKCGSRIDISPGSIAASVKPKTDWHFVECSFVGLPIRETGNTSMHQVASNPGEYEIKLLRKNRLSRSLKFTVGPDGNLTGGIPLVFKFDDDNRPSFPGVMLPVAILDDQDGPWDKNAWKTEAFYGNPPQGFTPAP